MLPQQRIAPELEQQAVEIVSSDPASDIRRAVEQLFGVHVTGVWTSNQRGKLRRVGRTAGHRAHWKKAIVKLRAGESIAVFEG